MSGYVVGVDVGATSTRALVARIDGSPVGRGTSGGANPNSHPPEVAAERIAAAIAEAFGELSPADAENCVLGMAGLSKFSDQAVADIFHTTLQGIGLTCPIQVVSDAEVAFASATAEPDGTIVVGGTGSIVARIVGHRKVASIGGLGWLLGDEGSAFWIGREAVRATLRALQFGAPIGSLAAAVLLEALELRPPPDLSDVDEKAKWYRWTSERLITAANAEPPIRLARFAPLVSENVSDPAAEQIVHNAADVLVDNVMAARSPGERTPVVLAGGVIAPGSPVGTRLRAAIAAADPAVPVHFASDGAAGAARLAATDLPSTRCEGGEVRGGRGVASAAARPRSPRR